jgi:hypothetical protein
MGGCDGGELRGSGWEISWMNEDFIFFCRVGEIELGGDMDKVSPQVLLGLAV